MFTFHSNAFMKIPENSRYKRDETLKINSKNNSIIVMINLLLLLSYKLSGK